MGKQWLYLVEMAFILLMMFFGWDLYNSFAGDRANFSYNLIPINTNLYEGLEQHFASDPKYVEYQQIADQIDPIEYFRPPAPDLEVADEIPLEEAADVEAN